MGALSSNVLIVVLVNVRGVVMAFSLINVVSTRAALTCIKGDTVQNVLKGLSGMGLADATSSTQSIFF